MMPRTPMPPEFKGLPIRRTYPSRRRHSSEARPGAFGRTWDSATLVIRDVEPPIVIQGAIDTTWGHTVRFRYTDRGIYVANINFADSRGLTFFFDRKDRA